MAKKNRVTPVKAPVSKNEQLTASVTDLTYQGMGVVKVDHYPLFVKDALPGEEIQLQVTKPLKNYGFARVVKRLTTSPDRAPVVDQIGISTGIAPLINLKYPAQLTFKQNQVQELFKKVHLPVTVAKTLGMDNPSHYRNKAQVPVQNQHGHLVTGFYRRGSHQLVAADEFYIQDEHIDQAIKVTREILDQFQVTAYDERSRRGVLRHLMARYGRQSGELMAVLVTNGRRLPHAQEIVAALQDRLPDLKSVVQNINDQPTNVIMGSENVTLWGQAEIKDQLLGKTYLIGPNSFYQVNPQTTAKLYELAAQRAQLKPSDTVIDAYCGIGTIALTVADQVQKVYGVEVVPQAIENAKANAALNQVENVDFAVGDAPAQMAAWQSEGLRPDVIFVDPPRKGLTQEFIEAAVATKPERVVYISCNPATLARDAVAFEELGYAISGPIQPVDQFPQTVHIECVAVFERAQS
ncbi:23S rRNA (uracil(1939)-C(5))-methyltransferase RlmD [Lactobacillaceae bacterium L1_55_11]|nr:23S rRNA (uracil(1939)-C(5))-methyltransferase RlmD [Lactobacillaceae bacterium L1_55_11]